MKINQASEILSLIRQNNQVGTENWKLAEISLKYSSRISELRAKGYDIYSVRQKREGKATGTWKYYIREHQPEPKAEKPKNARLFEPPKNVGYF